MLALLPQHRVGVARGVVALERHEDGVVGLAGGVCEGRDHSGVAGRRPAVAVRRALAGLESDVALDAGGWCEAG